MFRIRNQAGTEMREIAVSDAKSRICLILFQPPMKAVARIKKALRGNISISRLPFELVRRVAENARRSGERRDMHSIEASPARLSPEFSHLSPDTLLEHFRNRDTPKLWALNAAKAADLQPRLFPEETARLIQAADTIANDNTWEVGGFGAIKFDRENYWRCDPLTGKDWGLAHHSEIEIYTPGG
ncbi:MAG TPA: hypothetical protein VGO43_04865, partial [Pyrinomonadaceae bacterium]|nr:hypothetical protein [Pyrinomonadaceae bacterium]